MDITFGRFTDAYKSKESSELWGKSVKLFDEKKYLESFKTFIDYLRNVDNNNIIVSEQDGILKVIMYQGTKLIYLEVNEKHISGYAKIATFEKTSVAFMRRLLEINYGLYYSRFAIKDNTIYIKTDSNIIDAFPTKIYYALKEIAIKADKMDESLPESFPNLKAVDDNIKIDIPQNNKSILIKYYRKWINEILEYVETLNQTSFEGGISYLFLNTIYKIDYFLKPQGKIMDELEKLSMQYFANDNRPLSEKNAAFKIGLKKCNEFSDEAIADSIYEAKYTFSYFNPGAHESIVSIINDNINNVKWYVDNKYPIIADSISEYIMGYCLYSYGIIKSVKTMFEIGMVILNSDFAKEIGYPKTYFDKETNKFNEEEIINDINFLIHERIDEFPNLKIDTTKLNFSSTFTFFNTYIKEISNLNFN